jgi:hypothetical protein
MTSEIMNPLLLVGASLLLLAMSAMCIARPRSIQKYAIRTMSQSWWPSQEWVKTPAYILSLRICGVIALIMGLLLLWIASLQIYLLIRLNGV